jgi:transcriptional regulator with XRE-family HTH domain
MTEPDSEAWQRRAELADFLQTRRDRLRPNEVGLPTRRRRRTQGLRREDVAELAGISLTWYTWLEQGRDIRVSVDVLENLVRALRLSNDERAHLFRLADRPLPEPTGEPDTVLPVLRTLLGALEPFPAHVRDARWFVLAWNRAETLLVPWGKLPPGERHVIWNHFANPDLRRLADDWENDARTLLALFRQEVGPRMGDPALTALVARLLQMSPEFADWWSAHEVQQRRTQPIRVAYPDGELLLFERVTLTLEPGSGLTLRVLVPLADEETRSS